MKSSEVIDSIVFQNDICNDLNLSRESLEYIDKLKQLDFDFPDSFNQTEIASSNVQSGVELGNNYYGFKVHKRCFYKKIDNTWFAFKGVSFLYPIDIKPSESLIYENNVQEQIHHFAELEHEIPYGMTLQACIEDYNSPLEFIKDYIKKNQTCPLVPYPLFVYKLNNNNEIITRNKQILETFSLNSSKHLLQEYYFKQDLGIYVYVLNTSPVRIGHLSNVPSDKGLVILDHTIKIVVEMLKLGYIPCKMENTMGFHNAFHWGKNKGMCIAPWNITLEGAILDFNSVKSIKEYTNSKNIRYDIQLTIQWLAKLILWLDTKYSYLLPKIQRSWINNEQGLYNESAIYLQQALFSRIKEEINLSQLDIDKEIRSYFNPCLNWKELRLLC